MQSIILQAANGGGISQLVVLVLVVIIFYFFMIRPQMKKQKEAKKFQEEVKKGDKVVTIGGIIGKIAEIHDNYYMLEVEGGNRLRVLKTAISMENSVSINNAETPKA